MSTSRRQKSHRRAVAKSATSADVANFDREQINFDDPPEIPLEPSLDKDTIKKRTVHGAFSYFLTTLLLNLIALAANFYLSAYLSPEDFGIYGIVMQITGLLVFFSDVGLASSLIQKKTDPTDRDYHTIFWTQQLLSWFILAICLVIMMTGVLATRFGEVSNLILLAMAISFPLSTLKTVSSIKLSRQMKYSRIVIPQIFEQIFYNAVLIIMVWQGTGVLAYAYAIIIRSVVGVIAMLFIQPYLPRFQFDRQSFRQTIRFGLKFQANDLLARIKDQFFYMVLGFSLPAAEFGYIAWAKQWSMYPYNLTVQNVMNITFPTFSRLQDQPQLLRRAIERSLFFITAIIFPILVGMCVFIGPLTVVIARFQKWQPALLTFVLFTLGIAWSAISSPLTNTLNAIGKINSTLKLMVFWTILTWGLTFPCLWIFGFDGVAIAAFIISCTSLLPAYLVKKVVSFQLWSNLWRQLLAALVMAVFGLVYIHYWSPNLPNLILGGALSGLVYGATLLLVGWKKVKTELLSLRARKKS